MRDEIPNCPLVEKCQCYKDSPPEHCICPPTEKALRAWCRPEPGFQPMTPEQREWCLKEIDQMEGYRREDYQTCSDELLANGVLSSWVDYCRDKGLL